jgi:hypothetical protein
LAGILAVPETFEPELDVVGLTVTPLAGILALVVTVVPLPVPVLTVTPLAGILALVVTVEPELVVPVFTVTAMAADEAAGTTMAVAMATAAAIRRKRK